MIFYCPSCIFSCRFWPSFPPGPGKTAEMPAFYHPPGHNFPVRQTRKVFCRQQESPFFQRTLFYTAIIRVLNPVIRGGQTTTRAYVQNGLSPVWGHSFTGSLNDGLNTSTATKTVGGFIIIATFKTITLPIKE